MRNRKRFLAGLLALCMVLALLPVSALAADDTASADGSYNDVAENYWGKEAIDRWSSLEIMQGTGSGNFEPEREMYRCEFATVLVRLMGYTDVGDVSFPDLPEDAWYTDAMLKLAAAGVMQGDGYNAMPMGVITREQVAVLLCRALGLKPTGEGELPFKDSDEVDSWAKDAMTALAERGMINGVGENTLAPLANITRASVAQLTSNMIAYYVTEDTVITDETVKGIVLVAGDAKVTLENTTTENPVVVAPKADSAEVVLAGTTKAEDINVAANNATVTVAETASASNVSVSGTEATIDVEGKVETVTVNEGGSNASVTVGEKAEVTTVAANGTAAKVDVAGKVETVAVGEQASNAAVNVAKGAEVTTVETDAAGTTVAVAGTVGTVAVGETAEKSNVSVAKGAAVTDVNTAAPETSVDVAGKVTNVTVAETAADTALTVERNATVAKVETAADNVSVDGSGKVTNMTVTAGEGVTVSKDTTVTKVENQSDSTVAVGNKNVASGNTSSNRPSTGGSSGGTTNPGTDPGTTTNKYTVSIGTVTGGTVTPSTTGTNDDETVVTLTVAPTENAEFPYILKELKVTGPAAEGETEPAVVETTLEDDGTYTFTMTNEGNYTVNATFVQPITALTFEAGKDADNNDPTLTVTPTYGDVTDAKPSLSALEFTLNGTTIRPTLADGTASLDSAFTIYIVKPTDSTNKSYLSETAEGTSGTYTVSFEFKGITYSKSVTYEREGATLVNVVINGAAAVSCETGASVTLATPENENDKYYTGEWSVQIGDADATTATLTDGKYTIPDETEANTTITLTPKFVEITEVKPITREAGAGGGQADYNYAAQYALAGMTYNDGVLSIDQQALKTYVENTTNKTAVGVLSHANSVYYGLTFPKPEAAKDATKVIVNTTGAFDFSNLGSAGDDVFETALSPDGDYAFKNTFIEYFSAATVAENADQSAYTIASFSSNSNYTYCLLWTNDVGTIFAVTKSTITREMTNPVENVTASIKDVEGSVSVPYAAAIGEDAYNALVEKAAIDNYTVIGLKDANNETVTKDTRFTADTNVLTAVYAADATFAALAGNDAIEQPFGGTAGTRQNITIGEFTAKAGAENTYVATVTGSLNFGSWKEFSSDADEQVGYYSLFKLNVPEALKDTAKITYNNTVMTNDDYDEGDKSITFITRMGGADLTDLDGLGCIVQVDWDGAGDKKETTYIFDFSAVELIVPTDGATDLTVSTNQIDNKDDIRDWQNEKYICFQLKKDSELFKVQEGNILAAASQAAGGELTMRTLWVTDKDQKPAGPALELPSETLKEDDTDYAHHVGMTFKMGDAAQEITYYFWTADGAYKATFTVPAKTDSTVDKNENTPDNSGVQGEADADDENATVNP